MKKTYAAMWYVESLDPSEETTYTSGLRFKTAEEAEEYGIENFGENFIKVKEFVELPKPC